MAEIDRPNPMESVSAAENDLRELVERKLRQAHGERWFEESGLSSEEVSEARRRMASESRVRVGARTGTRPLDYVEFGQLKRIIEKRWHLLKGVLGNKNVTDAYLGVLAGLRLPSAHSRTLLPYEIQLLGGIAGHFRTLVTVDRSEMDPAGEFYSVIESVTDNFGSTWPGGVDPGAVWKYIDSGLRLEVGQVITFEAVGWDPQGRELIWELRKSVDTVGVARGTTASLVHEVSEDDVGESAVFTVCLRSSSKFARHAGQDDRVDFEYSVNPPRVAPEPA